MYREPGETYCVADLSLDWTPGLSRQQQIAILGDLAVVMFEKTRHLPSLAEELQIFDPQVIPFDLDYLGFAQLFLIADICDHADLGARIMKYYAATHYDREIRISFSLMPEHPKVLEPSGKNLSSGEKHTIRCAKTIQFANREDQREFTATALRGETLLGLPIHTVDTRDKATQFQFTDGCDRKQELIDLAVTVGKLWKKPE